MAELIDFYYPDKQGGMQSNYPYISYGGPRMGRQHNMRGLLQFTLTPPITGGGEITKIEVGFVPADVNYGAVDGNFHLLNHNIWVEGEACWDNYANNEPWINPGGDFSDTIIDTVTVPWSGQGYWFWWTVYGSGAANPISWNWGEIKSFLCKASASTPELNCLVLDTAHTKLRVTHEPPVRTIYSDTIQRIGNAKTARTDTKQVITNLITAFADTIQKIQGPEELARADTLQAITNQITSHADIIVKIRDPFFLPRLLDNLPRFVVRNDLLELGILKPIAEAMDEFRAFSNSLPDYAFGDHD